MSAAPVSPVAPAPPDEDVRCAHCGLPVPSGLVAPGAPAQFCCAGCRLVRETILRCGLGRYYELRDEAETGPGRATASDYEPFDDPAFHARHVTAVGDHRRRAELYLEGVHCAACVWLVERLPQVLDGVGEARLDFRRCVLRLTWDPARVELSRIARLLDRLGYPPHPNAGEATEAARRRESRRHLIGIGIAGACAANVMLIAFALYGGMLEGMAPAHRTFLRAASLVVTLVAVAGPGRVFFARALAALRAGVLHMDLPVAIALAAGTAWGAANTVRGAGEVYFESLTAVIFLLLVGRWIQFRQQRAAHDAVDLLFCITPTTARRLDPDGASREVPIDALAAGARIEVRAGDGVPADGVVESGHSRADVSLLTGESRPVPIGPGDAVHAGATNLEAPITVRVERAGAETRAGRLAEMIERLSRQRPPIVRLADRVAHHFVLTVLVLALLTALLWLPRDPALAVEHAIALLIVTCPCALGLATPLAFVAAIGRAARAGIFVKGGTTLERLNRPGLVLLDKTGTLTQGRTAVAAWEGADDVKPLVAAVEARVAHPVAAALVTAFAGSDVPPAAEKVVHVPGRGVEGRAGGRSVVVGAPAFVRSRVGETPAWAQRAERRCVADALTPVFVAVDGAVAGVAGLGDPVREEAADALAALEGMGWEVAVLSGDHPDVVGAVGRRLGLRAARCEGGATPERKVEAVRAALATHETVVMVGDGVNDAAALAAASVGVAVHGGAEASLRAADVFLRRPGLDALVALVRGARRSVGVVRRNVVASLLYNVVAGSLAVAGLINPLVAAVLMPISSLTVLTLSYRSRTFEA